MELPGQVPSERYANVLLRAGIPRPSRRLFFGIHAEKRPPRVDFIGEVKDAKGALAGNVGDDITVKLKGETALAQLQPCKYTCQVSVVEPSAQKFAVWRSNMVLLP
jgi:hypothetical protein